MKRRVFAVLLALTLSVTAVPFADYNAETVKADVVVDIPGENIAFKNESLADPNGFLELCVGDETSGWTDAVDKNGNVMELGKDWAFVSDDSLESAGFHVQFYSDLSDSKEASGHENHVDFDGVIPVEAFGKYVYRWVAIVRSDNTSDVAFKLLRSIDPVTDFGGTDYQTFALNPDKKTVRVYTIFNSKDAFDAAFQKTITVGKKKYNVTAIGNDALDNTNGATGLQSVTLHSGITTIEKNAFKGAKNLKSITIEGNLKKVGKNAFKGINKKAVFQIKASESNYNKIVKKIKSSGVAKTVTFKRI